MMPVLVPSGNGAERFLGEANRVTMMTLLAQYASPTMPPGAAAAVAGFFGIIFLFSIAITVLIIVAYYFIAQRAGFNPWLSLLALIPGVNLILIFIFAFSEWPIQREVRVLRAQLAGGGTPGVTAYGDAASGYAPGRGPIQPL